MAISYNLAQLGRVSWFPFSDEPMIHSQWYMSRLCDPSILLPSLSPDGKWHLFAHTWVGLEHFTSENGIRWQPLKMIEFRGHSPFVYYENGVWYLIYEKHDKLFQKFSRRRKELQNIATSRFEMRSSTDLILFSEPKIILDSIQVPFSHDGLKRARISRPQLFKTENGYRLYYGASHIVLEKTLQKVTRYFAVATSNKLEGPYIDNRILLEPKADDPYRNMATGSVKVVQTSDGFAAFDCSFQWDATKGKTISKMVLLSSLDGLDFVPMKKPVILSCPQKGWASRFITSCDVHYKADEQCWYCYFSANSKRVFDFLAREAVGLLLGKDPSLRKFPTPIE